MEGTIMTHIHATGASTAPTYDVPNHDAPEAKTGMRWTIGTLNAHWYVAALSRQVTGKKPFASTVMDERLVLFRGADGRATALKDRCLHRNAALSEGDLFDGCIGCPYHGWTYDASGECITVPSEGPGNAPR